jgi:hypothetical protein
MIDEVTRLVEKWRDRLGIDPLWKIAIRINETPSDESNEDCQKNVAYVDANEYLTAELTVNAWNVNEDLEETVVHELLHIVLRPYELVAEAFYGPLGKDIALDLVESTNERLTRAFMKIG